MTSETAPLEDRGRSTFSVRLDVFEGPFDLLLQLIAKHKLDVTLVAISAVTDEFIAHIRAAGDAWDLDQATEFLVVAATLLDLKAARLLPTGGNVEDEEDLALLEARDLLFARLLQYRAFKEIAAIFAARMASEGRRYPRAVQLEPGFASLLPEVLIGLGPAEFAGLAARTLQPRETPVVAIDHVHAPRVNVREQSAILAARLRAAGSATFRGLTADCTTTLEIVGRFLALLELYREGAVAFDQMSPLGELHVRWAGEADAVAETEHWADGEPDPYDALGAPEEEQ